MLMIRESGVRARHPARMEALRIQVAISLIVAVLLPSVLMYPQITEVTFSIPALINSMIGAMVGVVFGLLLNRRVTSFPGAGAFVFVLPSYAASYATIVTIFFSLRLDYSRLYLGLSFAFALIASYSLGLWLKRYVIPRFYVLPFGKTSALTAIDGVEWVIMRTPVVPKDASAVAIVADLRFDHDPVWERMLAEAAVNGCPVYHVKQVQESLTGCVSIEHLSENGFGSLLPNLAYVKIKRILDVILSITLAPIIVLPCIIIAILIKLDSAGPVIFVQERMGYKGRPFRMLKFRTMRPRVAHQDEEAARKDAMTQHEDLRVTRLGRVLRRMRLDELPQLINVLRGEMSLIGPRPEAMALSRWYESEIPFYFYRHIVRPGLSGWAQVHQGHVTDLNDVGEKLNYDFYYIKNFSAWLDLLISVRTIQIIISGFGSK